MSDATNISPVFFQQIADFRDKCSMCFVYDWITIPLVYTQVNLAIKYISMLATIQPPKLLLNIGVMLRIMYQGSDVYC